jgi:hypothetical protein
MTTHIKNAKVGDRIKVPITEENYFTFSEEYLATGNYIVATVLEQSPGGMTIIGWDESKKHARVIANSKTHVAEAYLDKGYGKLSHSILINGNVPYEKIVATVKRKVPQKSLGLLLGSIVAGAGVSRLSSRKMKGTVSLAKRSRS